MGKMNCAVFISGGGSTLQAVLRACKDHRLRYIQPVLVISSDPHAGGIQKALDEDFPKKDIIVLVRKSFATRENYGNAILKECRLRSVECIAQCGFTPLTPGNVVHEYASRIFNQHPGPLDRPGRDFGGKGMRGLAVHEAVLRFARLTHRPFSTEATVHFVDEGLDTGKVIGVRPVAVNAADTAETLATRVLPEEHGLVIAVLNTLSSFSGIRPIVRKHPLVEDGEIPLLEKAKREAVERYPKG
ncbi:MAG: phosphoribosylglycinamide formyltransferase [Parcubacteria group bacterium]|nr:phosphoribosylglycinamide formyltransferase [Parcubacteria group bacterium]